MQQTPKNSLTSPEASNKTKNRRTLWIVLGVVLAIAAGFLIYQAAVSLKSSSNNANGKAPPPAPPAPPGSIPLFGVLQADGKTISSSPATLGTQQTTLAFQYVAPTLSNSTQVAPTLTTASVDALDSLGNSILAFPVRSDDLSALGTSSGVLSVVLSNNQIPALTASFTATALDSNGNEILSQNGLPVTLTPQFVSINVNPSASAGSTSLSVLTNSQVIVSLNTLYVGYVVLWAVDAENPNGHVLYSPPLPYQNYMQYGFTSTNPTTITVTVVGFAQKPLVVDSTAVANALLTSKPYTVAFTMSQVVTINSISVSPNQQIYYQSCPMTISWSASVPANLSITSFTLTAVLQIPNSSPQTETVSNSVADFEKGVVDWTIPYQTLATSVQFTFTVNTTNSPTIQQSNSFVIDPVENEIQANLNLTTIFTVPKFQFPLVVVNTNLPDNTGWASLTLQRNESLEYEVIPNAIMQQGSVANNYKTVGFSNIAAALSTDSTPIPACELQSCDDTYTLYVAPETPKNGFRSPGLAKCSIPFVFENESSIKEERGVGDSGQGYVCCTVPVMRFCTTNAFLAQQLPYGTVLPDSCST